MLEERLEGLYQKVIEIEKFAETKNSILLTFTGVILLLLYSIFETDLYSFPNIFYASSIFISLFISILSFLPYKNPIINPNKNKIPFNKSMDVFNVKDLAKVSYLDKNIFELLSGSSSLTYDEYQEQLLKGILFNARITRRKLVLFAWSIHTFFVFPMLVFGVVELIRFIKMKYHMKIKNKLEKTS